MLLTQPPTKAAFIHPILPDAATPGFAVISAKAIDVGEIIYPNEQAYEDEKRAVASLI
jgi:hypothetical protein